MSSEVRQNAASPIRRRLTLTAWELRLTLGNAEQVLLSFIIPIVLLFAVRAWDGSADVLPAIVTVSALATAFTSLAISTGFERRSGTLRFLATTPLSRFDIMIAKVLAQGLLAMASLLVVIGIGALVGESIDVPRAALAVPCALIAFGSWGFWLGGRFRAEAVLAIANAVFVLLIAFGGVLFAADTLPVPLDIIVGALPTALLVDALRSDADFLVDVLGLLIWAVLGTVLVRRSFRWE